MLDRPTGETETTTPDRSVEFAHPSEKAFADLLDYYGVAWQYEPRTFVLERDGDGNITSAFTPDFYLPDFETFVELTMLRQPLVTRKHRKLRRLAETHPEVHVKLLYRRDVQRLADKYGLAAAA